MSILYPFPHFHTPPPGTVTHLPVTRNGIRNLSPAPFVRRGGPSFPVVQIGTTAGSSWGIGGLLPATAFSDGSVRPHEDTLSPRLARQRELVLRDGGALGKPVLLTVPTLAPLRQTLQQVAAPLLRYHTADLTYCLHAACGQIAPLPLAALGTPVIADGHHRAYTHAALAADGVAGFDMIPVVLMGGDTLHIDTFMRVIQTTKPPAQLLTELSAYFHIQPTAQSSPVQATGQWLYSYRKQHYHLSRKASRGDTTTDAGWLSHTVLPTVFGISDLRLDDRIDSVPPPPLVNGHVQLPPRSDHEAILLGKPIITERFFAEVDAGRLLPPKSTYFSPRLPSGLLVWIPGD